MKHLISTPCSTWAAKLIACQADGLTQSEHRLLKEHLLSCPSCASVHRHHLAVEAQLHSLPLLQPERLLSAKMLLEADPQEQVARSTAHRQRPVSSRAALQRYAAMIQVAGSVWLRDRLAQLRRPAYASLALLLCMLTILIGVGAGEAGNSVLHGNSSQQAPHLVSSTTRLALHMVNTFSSALPAASTDATQKFMVASATLTLYNTGEQQLIWSFNQKRSSIAYWTTIRLGTLPSQGTLSSHTQSLVQVIAIGTSRQTLPVGNTVELGTLVFSSNGGEAIIRTILNVPSSQAQHASSARVLALVGGLPMNMPLVSAYTSRKQSFF